MDLSQIAGKAKFTVTQSGATVEDVWKVLTAPFDEKFRSWHPSYGHFEPVRSGADGRPYEFEVCGMAGGRYPVKVEIRDDTRKVLRVWKGPSLNPPKGTLWHLLYRLTSPGIPLGQIYHFTVGLQDPLPVIDIRYREDWQRQFLSRPTSFVNGPKREIEWIFGKFALSGRLSKVEQVDAATV